MAAFILEIAGVLWRGHSDGGLQWKNIKNNSRFIQSVL